MQFIIADLSTYADIKTKSLFVEGDRPYLMFFEFVESHEYENRPKPKRKGLSPPFFRGENVSFMECKKQTCRKLTYPLKIDGWKMKNPFDMVPFQVTFVSFQGCTISRQLKKPAGLGASFSRGHLFRRLDAAHLVLCQSFGSN